MSKGDAAVWQVIGFVSFSLIDGFNLVYLSAGCIFGFGIQFHPVGCQCTQFYPLVVRIVVANDDARTGLGTWGGIAIYIHVHFGTLFLFLQRRQTGVLTLYVGTFFVEGWYHTVDGGGGYLGIREDGDSGSCS